MSKYGKLSLAALTALFLAGSALRAASAEPAASPDPQSGVTAPAAAPTELRSVSIGDDASGGPVVTLTGSGPLAYTTLELENPQRLVIDLKGTVSRVDRSQVAVDRGGVQRVRAGQFKRSPEPVSRVVIDLDGPVPYRIDANDSGLSIAFGATSEPATVGAAPSDPPSSPAAEAPVAMAETKVAEAPHAPAAQPVDAPAQPTVATRALAPDAIEKLLRSPSLAAEEPPPGMTAAPTAQGNFETRAIVT